MAFKPYMNFDVDELLADGQILSAAEFGNLVRKLVAEAIRVPIPRSRSPLVEELWGRRRTYVNVRRRTPRRSISLKIRRAIFARDGGKCNYCGRAITWALYHCDHFEPQILGGSDEPENLRAACKPCNLSKGAKPPEEWLR